MDIYINCPFKVMGSFKHYNPLAGIVMEGIVEYCIDIDATTLIIVITDVVARGNSFND